jgi:drug/metabolite transporter (DMT)-like permease
VLQFVCLRPLSALRLPWQVHALFLREPLNLLQLAGAALVILSVMYLTDRKRAMVPS